MSHDKSDKYLKKIIRFFFCFYWKLNKFDYQYSYQNEALQFTFNFHRHKYEIQICKVYKIYLLLWDNKVQQINTTYVSECFIRKLNCLVKWNNGTESQGGVGALVGGPGARALRRRGRTVRATLPQGLCQTGTVSPLIQTPSHSLTFSFSLENVNRDV